MQTAVGRNFAAITAAAAMVAAALAAVALASWIAAVLQAAAGPQAAAIGSSRSSRATRRRGHPPLQQGSSMRGGMAQARTGGGAKGRGTSRAPIQGLQRPPLRQRRSRRKAMSSSVANGPASRGQVGQGRWWGSRRRCRWCGCKGWQLGSAAAVISHALLPLSMSSSAYFCPAADGEFWDHEYNKHGELRSEQEMQG